MIEWLIPAALPYVASLIVPTLMVYVWKVFQRVGWEVDEAARKNINEAVQDRAGLILSMLATGKIDWSQVRAQAISLAKEIMERNTDSTKRVGLEKGSARSELIIAEKIESKVAQAAVAAPGDTGMVLPTAPKAPAAGFPGTGNSVRDPVGIR